MEQPTKPLDWIEATRFKTENGIISMIDPAQKYTIVTDWFSAILQTEMLLVVYDAPLEEYKYDDGNICFQKMSYAAPMFNFAYKIFFKGKLFGKIHVSPKQNGVLKNNNMQFELENNVQYEVGWLDDMKYVFEKMRWKVRNVSRCDIALDGGGFFKMWQLLKANKITRMGASKQQVFSRYCAGIEILEGFDVGSRSSDKWLTCYNKTNELQSSNKIYISDFWQRSGLDTKNVERMELKLRNDALKEINFDWKKMDDFEYLSSVFRTFVDGGYVDIVNEETGGVIRKFKRGILQFVEANSDKNISRKKKIQFINWEYIGAKPLERFSTQKANEVWAMKLTCKRLCLLAHSIKDKYPARSNQFLMEAHEVAKNINCLQWLIDRYDKWLHEFSLMKLDYLPAYTLNTVNESRRVMSLKPCNAVPADLFFTRM